MTGSRPEVFVYVDSSVVVALLAPDDTHHRSVRRWAEREPSSLLTSTVAEVEVGRALGRRQAPARVKQAATRMLARLEMVELTAGIRATATAVRPASTRSLDAVHVATALTAGVNGFATLDTRQRVAAEEMGLTPVEIG